MISGCKENTHHEEAVDRIYLEICFKLHELSFFHFKHKESGVFCAFEGRFLRKFKIIATAGEVM